MRFGIRAVAVIGTGTMGQGIAQVVAQVTDALTSGETATAVSGVSTRIYDAASGRAEAAITAIGAQLERLVAKGKISAEQRNGTLSRLSPATSLAAACDGVDLIVEAIPENMDLKVSVLAEAIASAPRHAIVGSNTSSLSITELGARLAAGERTIGLHFFNPPPVMELLEVVRGLATSADTVEHALAFAARLGKTPIIVRDAPGFATSRLGVILGAEAIRMLETGVASAVDIDKAMELGYRHPMGPLKLTDLVGLDVRLAILDHLHKEVGEQFRAPSLLRTMVRAGKLGKKSGEGFYIWKDGAPIAK